MSKSKVVLVVDLTSVALEEAVEVMKRDVLQRMFNTPENSIALVLVGTPNTEVSQITGNVDSFDNITVTRPLLIPDKSLVQLITDIPNRKSGAVKKSLVPALELAVRLFHQEPSKTHWMSENRIMLFTDESGKFDGNSGFVATEMNGLKPQIVFKLIGPMLYSDGETDDNWASSLPQNCQSMLHFCNQVDQADNISTEDATMITRLYKTKVVRQTPSFKGCLEVGSGTQLPIFISAKISASTHQQSLKMCDGSGEPVIRDRIFHLNDEKQTRIDPDCMNKGYRYGKSFIPISKVDSSLMNGETEKELVLICTTKRSNIRKEEICVKAAHAVTAPPDNAGATAGLAAFATALRDLNMVAICRYVRKDDTPPKLCCLLPNVREYRATLMMVEMPFSNVIKKAEFPKIKAEPTTDQLNAIDSLIDSMDLSTTTDFKASEIANPDIQRRYECATHKLLHPKVPIPTVDMSHFFKPPQFHNSSDAVKVCNQVFNIVQVEEKVKKRAAGEMFDIDKVDQDEKNDIKKIKKDDICLDNLLGSEVKISTTAPLQDFEVVQGKLGAEAACRMMRDVITRIVQYGGVHLAECLISLRRCCVKNDLFGLFNDFLKQVVANSTVKKILKDNNLSLIHRAECSGSPVLEGEAEFFLKSDEICANLEVEDDDDDLLDDL